MKPWPLVQVPQLTVICSASVHLYNHRNALCFFGDSIYCTVRYVNTEGFTFRSLSKGTFKAWSKIQYIFIEGAGGRLKEWGKRIKRRKIKEKEKKNIRSLKGKKKEEK